MEDQYKIAVRLAGPDIAPDMIRAGDMATVLTAVEDMIAATVLLTNKNLRREQIIVGLTSVEPGSVGLGFAPQLAEIVHPAWLKISDAVAQDNYEELGKGALDGLSKLQTVSHRYDCIIEMGTMDRGMNVLATITPETEIRRRTPLRGETVVYGQIIRIGGREPRFMFQPIGSDQVVYGDLPEALARKLATHLYDVIGARGQATWNPYTLELEAFDIEGLTDFENVPIKDAISSLRDICEPYLDDIDNPDEYVYQLRHDDLED